MPGPDTRVDARAADAQWRRLARGPGAPWLHGEIARRMGERLALVKAQPAVVVDWGGYLGGGAAVLAQAYPAASRIVVEPHAALAERSRRAAAAPWWSHRRWFGGPPIRVADSAELPDGSAGLLWANMALHASADADGTLAEWHRLVAVDGFLMFSTVGPDTLLALRRCYESLGWPPPAQTFVDMHDIGDALVRAGFADPVMDQEQLTLTWADPAQLLAELRSLGGNLSPGRATGLRTPRWRHRLESAMGEQLRIDRDGRVGIGFEVVYGHAFRAPARVPVAGHAEVSVEDLRAMARRPRRPR